MNHLFSNENDESEQLKLNMDELYEEKQKKDLQKVSTYNKLLTRIHSKIKVISKQRLDNQACWYLMPEILIGAPNYDFTECLSYVMQKLKENGFVVKYTHPNLLFISWMHWVPTYVRNELKKKTGIIVDGYGNKIENTDAKNTDPNSKLFNKGQTSTKTVNTNYKSTDSYKPSGNSIYKADLLDKIKDKLG